MKNMKTVCAALAVSLFAFLFIAGCTKTTPTGHDHDKEIFEVISHACHHMNDGPASTVTVVSGDAQAPDISASHTRFDITLVGVEGGNGGNVTFTVSESGDYLLMLDKDVAVTVSQGGIPVPVEEMFSAQQISGHTDCTKIVKALLYDLAAGAALISFGPAPETTVSVAIEEAGHDH